MADLPELVIKGWKSRKDPVVFSTLDPKGIPNAIYVTCVSMYDPETIVIADNFFDKTRKNIMKGSKGTILFITEDKISYQVKGSIEYHKTGEIFNDMKKWNPAKLPGHAAVALKIEEVYSGSKKFK